MFLKNTKIFVINRNVGNNSYREASSKRLIENKRHPHLPPVSWDFTCSFLGQRKPLQQNPTNLLPGSLNPFLFGSFENRDTNHGGFLLIGIDQLMIVMRMHQSSNRSTLPCSLASAPWGGRWEVAATPMAKRWRTLWKRRGEVLRIP